jgi:hypothetical protein
VARTVRERGLFLRQLINRPEQKTLFRGNSGHLTAQKPPDSFRFF